MAISLLTTNLFGQHNTIHVDQDQVDNGVIGYARSGDTLTITWDDVLESALDYYKITLVATNGKTFTEIVYENVTSFDFYIGCDDVIQPGSVSVEAWLITGRCCKRDPYEELIYSSSRIISYYSGNPLVDPIGETKCATEEHTICFPDTIEISSISGNVEQVAEFRTFTWTSLAKNEVVDTGLCHTIEEDEYWEINGLKVAQFSVEVHFDGNANNADDCIDKIQVVAVAVVDLSALVDVGFSNGCTVSKNISGAPALSCVTPGTYCTLPETQLPLALRSVQFEQEWKHIDKGTGDLDLNKMTLITATANFDYYKVCFDHVSPQPFEDYRLTQKIKGKITYNIEGNEVDIDINCSPENDYRIYADEGFSILCPPTILEVNTSSPDVGSYNPFKCTNIRGDQNETAPQDYFYRWEPTDDLIDPYNRYTQVCPDSSFCGAKMYTLYKRSFSNPAVETAIYCTNVIGPMCTALVKVGNVENNIELDITNDNSELDLILYPNPTNGEFTLELEQAIDEAANIMIYSFQGRLLFSQIIEKGTIRTNFDFSSKANGVYTVVVTSKSKVATKKLIKL